MQLALNKNSLDRKAPEEKITQEFLEGTNYKRTKRRTVYLAVPKILAPTPASNDNETNSNNVFSISLQVAFQIKNTSIEIPFKTWNIF